MSVQLRAGQFAAGQLGGYWTPQSTPKLKLWLNADLGVMLNGSDWNAWADQSGHGFDVVQGTASKQPADSTLSNGKRAGLWDGVNTILKTTGGDVIDPGDWTFAAVVEPDITQPHSHLIDSSGAGGRLVMGVDANANKVAHYDGAWREYGASAGGLQAITWQLIVGAGATGYRDGAVIGTNSYPAVKGLGSSLSIGGDVSTGAGLYKGLVREIIAFSPALTTQQLQNLFAYQRRNSGTP